MDHIEEITDNPILRDAYEVGCSGLVAGWATNTRTGQRMLATEVTKLDGPFYCHECLTDAVVRKCTERKDHFAHKARLSPVIGSGERDLHKKCKKEIRDRLIELFPEGRWECERPIPANKEKNIQKLVPDISGRLNGIRVVIEVQASSLTIPRIVSRAAAYHARGCAILWLVPLTESLGNRQFRPRLYERYLHSIYYGRTYYWLPGDGLEVRPVHYDIAYRYIEESEWYSSDGEHQEAGGYEKPYKIVKLPKFGNRVNIAKDFALQRRGEFTPWNERKSVPELTTWQDTMKIWWNEEDQAKFEKRYENSNRIAGGS